MNIAMEQTEEYVNGQLKAKYGDAFIRGNNGTRRRLGSACCVHAPWWPALPLPALLLSCCARLRLAAPTMPAVPLLAVLYISTQKRKG